MDYPEVKGLEFRITSRQIWCLVNMGPIFICVCLVYWKYFIPSSLRCDFGKSSLTRARYDVLEDLFRISNVGPPFVRIVIVLDRFCVAGFEIFLFQVQGIAALICRISKKETGMLYFPASSIWERNLGSSSWRISLILMIPWSLQFFHETVFPLIWMNALSHNISLYTSSSVSGSWMCSCAQVSQILERKVHLLSNNSVISLSHLMRSWIQLCSVNFVSHGEVWIVPKKLNLVQVTGWRDKSMDMGAVMIVATGRGQLSLSLKDYGSTMSSIFLWFVGASGQN